VKSGGAFTGVALVPGTRPFTPNLVAAIQGA